MTISGLKGDLYDYELVMWHKGNASSDNVFYIHPNGDATAANKRMYMMRGYSSTVNGWAYDGSFNIEGIVLKGTEVALSKCRITGSSGDERYLDIFWAGKNGSANEVRKASCYWTNTVDELTSIELKNNQSVTTDAHIILYRTPKDASQEKWELVDTYSGTSVNYNTETEIFNGLDGDQDIQYKMVIRYDAGTNSDLGFRINSDSAASQYINQDLRNSGGSIQAGNNSRSHCQFTGSTGAENGLTDVEVIINAETGNRRLIEISYANINAGTDQSETAAWYKDTATNISTLELYDPISVTTNSLTAKLYRRKNPNTIGDTLPFEMVEEVAVSGDFSAGHTFSGLSGDDVLLYKLEFLADSTGVHTFDIHPNGDSAAGNYDLQQLRATTSTVSAFSSTSEGRLTRSLIASDVSQFVVYIYPKSGENRPAFGYTARGANVLEYSAGWWKNTIDGINSLYVGSDITTSITGTLKLSRITI